MNNTINQAIIKINTFIDKYKCQSFNKIFPMFRKELYGLAEKCGISIGKLFEKWVESKGEIKIEEN